MSAGPTLPAAALPRALAGSDPVTRVPGVNAARAKALARLGVLTVADLLCLAPRRFEDRRETTPAASLVEGATATFVGDVHAVKTIRARRGLVIVEAAASDATGEVRARWFNQPWLAKSLAGGGRFLLHGLVKASGRRLEFTSPAVERLPAEPGTEHPGIGRLVPIHPLTTGLSAAGCRAAVWSALASVEEIEDPVPARLFGEPPLPALPDAVRSLHFPASLEAAESARRRLAFDELLLHELLLARRRRVRERTTGIALGFTPTLDRRIRRRFPFPFTAAQNRAVADVAGDLARSVPMNRLVEGDVGSGKTAVAAYACLACIANKCQAAFMAPTEVLARQHEETLSRFLDGSRVRIASLYGSQRTRARREALERIAAGEADLVIGTHAVLAKDVAFKRLALVVVDEQHKFGVQQRRDLVVKGAAPHVLVMTATPIPRTLAMVVYGDLDLTRIEGRPPGRGPTETFIARPSDGAAVIARVREALALGRQAFVVYPLVTESDRSGLKDATAGCEAWRKALPGRRVGLVHGRLKAEERDAAMEAFRRRAVDVLVATVVVEVGIDVPNATVLVVEHAERFGLSQLHQLRGRVGRGPGGGLCVLLDRSAGDSPARLEVLAETEDGFRIAEEDLRLRGGGDLFGTRQHGAPGFVAARLPEDLPLLSRARTAARGLESLDPRMEAKDLRALRERVLAREREIGDPSTGG